MSEHAKHLAKQAVLAAVGVLLCVVSRAPGLLRDISLLGLGLTPTVEGVIAYGALALFGVIWWLHYDASHLPPRPKPAKGRRIGVGPVAFFLLPGVAILFLTFQIMEALRPINEPELEGLGFRALWDFSLLDWRAPASIHGQPVVHVFKGEPYETGTHIYPPIHTWISIGLGVAGLNLGYRSWKLWK